MEANNENFIDKEELIEETKSWIARGYNKSSDANQTVCPVIQDNQK